MEDYKEGTVFRKGDTVYDIEGNGVDKLGNAIADKVEYPKALGFRMTTISISFRIMIGVNFYSI